MFCTALSPILHPLPTEASAEAACHVFKPYPLLRYDFSTTRKEQKAEWPCLIILMVLIFFPLSSPTKNPEGSVLKTHQSSFRPSDQSSFFSNSERYFCSSKDSTLRTTNSLLALMLAEVLVQRMYKCAGRSYRKYILLQITG